MAGLALPLIAKEPEPVDDSAQRRAAAAKLLDLFSMDETYDQAMKQTMNMAVGMVENQDLPEPEKASARKAVEASIAISMEKFSWKHMKGIFIDIYSSVLALDELEGLIAFYESPIGQKFLKKRPQLNLATMEKMQQLMEEMMPDLQKAVDEAIQVEAVIELYGE
jgi:hypothetical protein